MAKVRFTEAFKKFGAKLTNPQWSVSARAPDGRIVLSCWYHRLANTGEAHVYRYSDSLSRFRGNVAGSNELREHLEEAQCGAGFRLVVARLLDSKDEAAVERGEGADKLPKTFVVKPEFLGRLEAFDGDSFSILFRPE